MKKFLIFLIVCLLLFLGLTYWSVSVGPSEVIISEVIEPKGISGEGYRNLKSVKVVPTNQYRANGIKKFMQGENYRKTWETPVAAEVFFLDSFDILEKGGGSQTQSLDIMDRDSIIYSLRSINKDPSPLVPQIAETLGLENIVIDAISAQHPYGAVLAASLADAAGILHTHPRIVYLPNHSPLAIYPEYANRLYLLEYETEGDVNWTSYPNVQRIIETDDLLELKAKMGDLLKIDTQELVKARLFDILIGDWDRHAKQWGWVLQQQGDIITAIPLPGDRDNAFFRIDGVIPTILTNKLVQPMVRPFEKDIDHLPGYAFYPFDHYFMQSVPEEVFLEEAKTLQADLSDEVIEKAVSEWLPESDILGKEIAQNLKLRRNKLPQYAAEFYREIQKGDSAGKPLKGSEDLDLPFHLQKCFDCKIE